MFNDIGAHDNGSSIRKVCKRDAIVPGKIRLDPFTPRVKTLAVKGQIRTEIDAYVTAGVNTS
jgi:hypothetical protein